MQLLISIFNIFGADLIIRYNFYIKGVLVVSFSFGFYVTYTFALRDSLLVVALTLFITVSYSSVVASSRMEPMVSPVHVRRRGTGYVRVIGGSSSSY